MKITEKAKSKAQQKFMGMVHAYQKGELKNVSPAVKRAAKSMDKDDVEDYAKTSHKNLPDKKEVIDKIREFIRKEIRGLDEERDYKDEYRKYGSSTKAKKYRAELNKYNRQKGNYGNGDKKDASHKGGKIVGLEDESKNRGRREKSRLKKEQKFTEGKYDNMLDKIEDLVKGANNFMGVGKVLKKAGIKYIFSTNMIPMYKLSKFPIAILNKKYVDKSDRTVGNIAIGVLGEGKLREMIRKELYNEASWHLKDYHRNDQLEKQFKKLKKGYYLADRKLNFYKITKIGKWGPRLGKNDLPDGRLTIKLVRLGPKIKKGAIGKGYEAPIWYSELAKQELTVMTKIKESVNEGQPLIPYVSMDKGLWLAAKKGRIRFDQRVSDYYNNTGKQKWHKQIWPKFKKNHGIKNMSTDEKEELALFKKLKSDKKWEYPKLESVNEVMGYNMKSKDKKVFQDFLDKNFNSPAIKKSQTFSVDKKGNKYILSGAYTEIAMWKGDKLYIHNYAYGNVSQTFLNYMKKAAKNSYEDFELKNLQKESINELREGKRPLIYSLSKRKQDIIYKMLWHRNQPGWHTPGEFEQLIKKYFNNVILPHIADGLDKTKNANDFVKFIRKFNFKESVKLKEAKKPVEIKLQGITFGKDYQGLSFKNGGVQYYYQKGKGAKHVESDYGKFIVKIGQLVTPATREKVAKKLKESINEARTPRKALDANKVKNPDDFWKVSINKINKSSGTSFGRQTDVGDVILWLNFAIDAWNKGRVSESINEGKWSKIMTSVRKGSKAGPWSIIVYQNKKVLHQRLVKVLQQIPAQYEDVKKKYPKAKIGIEDKYGERVYTESINEGKVSPSKVRSAVNKIKKQLIKKWKSKGGYENFGQKELRKLNDKFVDTSDYSTDMNKIRDILQQFDVWAMNYNESINERIDFRNVRRELEWEYPWDYVEEEGSGRIRFDWDRNRNSMWVNDDGSVEGGVPRDSGLKRKMKKLGIKESVNEATKINLNKFTKYIRSAIDSAGTKPDTTKIHAILLKLYPQASRKDLWNLARGIEDVGLSLGEGVIKESINEGKISLPKVQGVVNKVKKQLTESTLNDSELLSKDIVGIMKKYFPGSYYRAKWDTRLYESIQGTFVLGTKSQWANGISQNSPCYFTFTVDGMEDGNIGDGKVSFETHSGVGFMIKPSLNSRMAYERIKVPARKKTANSKAILKHIDSIFSNLKKSLKKNFDKMTPEHQNVYKKFIK